VDTGSAAGESSGVSEEAHGHALYAESTLSGVMSVGTIVQSLEQFIAWPRPSGVGITIECREQSGATMHIEFGVDATLVRDNRAGGQPHLLREVAA
jgi:hypothetical protein